MYSFLDCVEGSSVDELCEMVSGSVEKLRLVYGRLADISVAAGLATLFLFRPPLRDKIREVCSRTGVDLDGQVGSMRSRMEYPIDISLRESMGERGQIIFDEEFAIDECIRSDNVHDFIIRNPVPLFDQDKIAGLQVQALVSGSVGVFKYLVTVYGVVLDARSLMSCAIVGGKEMVLCLMDERSKWKMINTWASARIIIHSRRYDLIGMVSSSKVARASNDFASAFWPERFACCVRESYRVSCGYFDLRIPRGLKFLDIDVAMCFCVFRGCAGDVLRLFDSDVDEDIRDCVETDIPYRQLFLEWYARKFKKNIYELL